MALMATVGGELAALVGALAWAIASVIYSRLGQQIRPLELNLAKGILASALLALTLFVTGASLTQLDPPALGLLTLSGVLGIGLGDTAFFEALKCIGPRRTLLIGTLAPPLAAVIALVVMGESLSFEAWAGILLTGLGVAWVVTERVPDAGQAPAHLARGISAGLLAALAQAGGAVLSHAALTQTAISPLWAAFLRLAAGVLVLLVWIPMTRQPAGGWLRPESAAHLWGRLVLAILVGTYLAVWLQQVALKLTSAGVAQTLLSTSPLFVLPLAAWMGERVSARAILGALLTLAGIALLFSSAR